MTTQSHAGQSLPQKSKEKESFLAKADRSGYTVISLFYPFPDRNFEFFISGRIIIYVAEKRKGAPAVNKSVLVITTLGSFSVQSGSVMLSGASPRAQNLWKLFKFILTNRDHPIPTERLIELLWPDDDCENPIKALYSLMYRLRTLLNSGEVPKQDYILFQHNTYIWNKSAPCDIDVENFDRLITRGADLSLTPSARIDAYKQALSLYHGDYLSESSMEDWILPWSNYYKRLYSTAVRELAKLLLDEGDYAGVVRICEQAIERDPYEEALHEMLINGLICMGQLTQAMTHYNYISNLLYKELGVQPSDRLQKLYKAIHQSVQDVQYDIHSIKLSLREDPASSKGAFICDMDVFRQLYILESRTMERSGQVTYVAVITIANLSHMLPDNATLTRAMALLRQVCVSSLRRGDVVSQYSKSQVVMLLATITLEDCYMVMDRIKRRFIQSSNGLPVLLNAMCEPVDPPPVV
jgi:DNA-binding SARP family transcriptional activator